MAIGVDSSRWKPRRLQGTPAATFRNLVGIGILTFGVVCGLIFHNIDATKNLRKAVEVLYEDPIEEVERKQMIAAGLPNRTGDQIRKAMQEAERPDLPFK